MAINRRGEKVMSLVVKEGDAGVASIDYQNVVGQDSLTRFDKKQGGGRRFERRDRGGRDGYRNGGRRQHNNRREDGNE
jgi:hypothetical protein